MAFEVVKADRFFHSHQSESVKPIWPSEVAGLGRGSVENRMNGLIEPVLFHLAR